LSRCRRKLARFVTRIRACNFDIPFRRLSDRHHRTSAVKLHQRTTSSKKLEERMSGSHRFPGSREEDAWLSDEQLERCAPAETEPFAAPVPTRMIGNGEYMPFPQTNKQRHVEARVKELADKAAKKLGISRRQFLAGSGGLAASFLAMNEVFGNSFFKVDAVEMFEPAAAAENGPPKNLFVFDDQTHIVRSSTNTPQGLRALAQGPGSVSTAAGFSPATTPPFGNPNNGRGGNPAGLDELGSPWTPWNPAQLGPD